MLAILSFSLRPSTPGWMMRLAHATSSTLGRQEESIGEERRGRGGGVRQMQCETQHSEYRNTLRKHKTSLYNQRHITKERLGGATTYKT